MSGTSFSSLLQTHICFSAFWNWVHFSPLPSCPTYPTKGFVSLIQYSIHYCKGLNFQMDETIGHRITRMLLGRGIGLHSFSMAGSSIVYLDSLSFLQCRGSQACVSRCFGSKTPRSLHHLAVLARILGSCSPRTSGNPRWSSSIGPEELTNKWKN